MAKAATATKGSKADGSREQVLTEFGAVEPPVTQRTRKYTYTREQAEASVELLDNNGHPGQGGFLSETSARSAGQALLAVMAEIADVSDLGIRVWSPDEGDTHTFAIKVGRRKHPGRGGNDTDSE